MKASTDEKLGRCPRLGRLKDTLIDAPGCYYICLIGR